MNLAEVPCIKFLSKLVIVLKIHVEFNLGPYSDRFRVLDTASRKLTDMTKLIGGFRIFFQNTTQCLLVSYVLLTGYATRLRRHA